MVKMNQRKKLLITLGCSLTEGVGCYDYTLMGKDDTFENLQPGNNSFDKFYKPNRINFHNNGWPVHLAKKLGFDKLINLGYAGSSTSGQVKVLFEKYFNPSFEDYDVTIGWLLSEPARISFYKQGKVVNFNTSNFGDSIFDEYVINVSEGIDDFLLEQIFYIKVLETYCKHHNFNLFMVHSRNEFVEDIRKIHDTNKLYNVPNLMYFGDGGSDMKKNNTSKICNHPNEKGYKLIADRIYTYIKHSFPSSDNKLLDVEYNGNPTTYKSLL
jgi:hypothetical protein